MTSSCYFYCYIFICWVALRSVASYYQQYNTSGNGNIFLNTTILLQFPTPHHSYRRITTRDDNGEGKKEWIERSRTTRVFLILIMSFFIASLTDFQLNSSHLSVITIKLLVVVDDARFSVIILYLKSSLWSQRIGRAGRAIREEIERMEGSLWKHVTQIPHSDQLAVATRMEYHIIISSSNNNILSSHKANCVSLSCQTRSRYYLKDIG